MPNFKVYRNILKVNCITLAFFSYNKAFIKNKKTSGISQEVSFSAWFLKKKIYLIIFYT